MVAVEGVFDDALANCVDHLGPGVFFDDSDLVFGFKEEVGAEGVVEVEVDLLVLFLHWLLFKN